MMWDISFFLRLNNQFTRNAYVYLLLGLGAYGTVPCSCMMPGETLEPARERESGTGRSILAEDERSRRHLQLHDS